MKKELVINGMHCAACGARVEKALSALDGVKVKKVDFKKGRAVIDCTSDLSEDIFREAVTALGFEFAGVK